MIGFRDERLLLMPYEDITGIGVGSMVVNLNEPLLVGVGPQLLGKALDGLGYPLDGSSLVTPQAYPVDAPAPRWMGC